MRLVITTGSQAGRTLDVERRLVVGRDEACDLALEDDEKASRRHCAFSPNPDGTLTVEDLGSSNGTLVDGERISAPVVLRGGEEVRVGTTVFRIEREPAEQATLVAGPATVVGAPATQLASGPPPGEPPVTPAPATERPWWRSKWAVIGGAVALLAIGGIVGGVLAASGGGEDGPVAVATTDEQPTDEQPTDEQTVTEAETETQTETDTVETE